MGYHCLMKHLATIATLLTLTACGYTSETLYSWQPKAVESPNFTSSQGIQVFNRANVAVDANTFSAVVDYAIDAIVTAKTSRGIEGYTRADALAIIAANHLQFVLLDRAMGPNDGCDKCYGLDASPTIAVSLDNEFSRNCLGISSIGHELAHFLRGEIEGDADSKHTDTLFFGQFGSVNVGLIHGANVCGIDPGSVTLECSDCAG